MIFADSAAALRLLRSTKIERCSLAINPNNGQRATSLLATNDTRAAPDMIKMSK